MNTLTRTEEHQTHPRTWTAFRSTKLLVGGYTSISVLTLMAVVVLRNHATIVNSAVWTHGTTVAVSALLLFTFTIRAASGSRRAYLRLRIASAVTVVAIAIIIALSGTFPLRMKIEQGVCGLVLIGVVAIVNGRHMRSLFAAK